MILTVKADKLVTKMPKNLPFSHKNISIFTYKWIIAIFKWTK